MPQIIVVYLGEKTQFNGRKITIYIYIYIVKKRFLVTMNLCLCSRLLNILFYFCARMAKLAL